MRWLRILFALSFLIISQKKTVFSQYFQWLSTAQALHAAYVYDIATDVSGNVIICGTKQVIQSGTTFYVAKYNSAGVPQWTQSQFPGLVNWAGGVATDYAGNCYVTGTKVSGTISFDSIHHTTASQFLVKFAPQGNVLRLDSIGNKYVSYHIAADSAGNIYLTNDIITKKYSAAGNLIWQNSNYGGKDIAVDKTGQVYLIGTGSLTKLTASGQLAWTKPYGGKQIAVDNSGNSYVAAVDSIYKCNTKGNLLWSNDSIHGNSIAIDKNGKIYVGEDYKIYKLDNKGKIVIWSLPALNAKCNYIATDNVNCYLSGSFNPQNETVICPFHIQRVGMQDQSGGSRIFTTKVNQADPLPFQASIYTPAIHEDRLCSGVYFQVPYQVSLNQASSFGPGNEFRAELINQFGTLDIGRADSAFIPFSVPDTVKYRIRVVSTNPVIVGDANSPQILYPSLTLKHLTASITPAGNISVCNGDSIQLHATHSPNNSGYYWRYNNFSLSSGYYDTVITVSSAGDYFVLLYDGYCQLESTPVHLDLLPLPSPSVTLSGPLTFCNGDSVVLSAAQTGGYTYKWKKNNVNIPGATAYSYAAKTSGTYKVKVTDSNGCTKLSGNKTVIVNCREAIAEQDDLLAYPQPFSESFVLTGSFDWQTVKIYDLSGRLVWMISKGDFSNNESDDLLIDLSNRPPGVYVMEMQSPEAIRRLKIVKE